MEKLAVGDWIGVYTAGSLFHGRGHAAVMVEHVFGEIAGATEKAVQIKAKTFKGKEVTAWFPKKALQEQEGSGHFKLAKWFKATGWTAKFLELCSVESCISA